MSAAMVVVVEAPDEGVAYNGTDLAHGQRPHG